jgi:diphosphomevalonate decarboxylase
VKNIVPQRMKEMEKAIIEKDFETFADLTMKDSDNFHACCKDTDPPIIYMNDISHKICNLIHKFNQVGGKKRAAYTFDAGPNAVVFLLKEDLIDFLSLVIHYFPPKTLDTKYKFLKFANSQQVFQK